MTMTPLWASRPLVGPPSTRTFVLSLSFLPYDPVPNVIFFRFSASSMLLSMALYACM